MTIAHDYGFGRHFFFLTPLEKILSQKYTFINEPLGKIMLNNRVLPGRCLPISYDSRLLMMKCTGIASSACGRLSFMVLLYKLFGTTKARRWFIMFLAIQTVVINLFTAITIFTQCPHDINSLWDKVGHPSECWSPNVQTVRSPLAFVCDQSLTSTVHGIFPRM